MRCLDAGHLLPIIIEKEGSGVACLLMGQTRAIKKPTFCQKYDHGVRPVDRLLVWFSGPGRPLSCWIPLNFLKDNRGGEKQGSTLGSSVLLCM